MDKPPILSLKTSHWFSLGCKDDRSILTTDPPFHDYPQPLFVSQKEGKAVLKGPSERLIMCFNLRVETKPHFLCFDNSGRHIQASRAGHRLMGHKSAAAKSNITEALPWSNTPINSILIQIHAPVLVSCDKQNSCPSILSRLPLLHLPPLVFSMSQISHTP